MYLLRNCGVACVCLCVCATMSSAQKKITKVVSQVAAKPAPSLSRPPLIEAGQVTSLSKKLQQNLMQGWNLALSTQVERAILPKATGSKRLMPKAQTLQRNKFVVENMQPLKDYIASHQNNWPEYGKNLEANKLVHYVFNVLEQQNPTPEILELQREIIRLRATSNARSPYEVVQLVGAMIEYGFIPSRATMNAKYSGKSEDEIALGEDLAFAIVASKVPMQANPWKKISGFDRIVDIVHTYQARSRQDMLQAGIPETYIGAGGLRYQNIELLTQDQYLNKQYFFAVEHPFEFVLAPFWERVFGNSFYRTFNNLSNVEKEAVLFTAPKLPQAVNVDSQPFSLCYENAVNWWIERNGRQPNHYAGEELEKLKQFLTSDEKQSPSFSFRTELGRQPFIDLSYSQQTEVLMWIWKNLHILPTQALERFEVDSRNYF